MRPRKWNQIWLIWISLKASLLRCSTYYKRRGKKKVIKVIKTIFKVNILFVITSLGVRSLLTEFVSTVPLHHNIFWNSIGYTIGLTHSPLFNLSFPRVCHDLVVILLLKTELYNLRDDVDFEEEFICKLLHYLSEVA